MSASGISTSTCSARFQAGEGLAGVHCASTGSRRPLPDGQAVGQVRGDVLDAVMVCHFLGLARPRLMRDDHAAAVDVPLMPSRYFDTEGASTCECDFDGQRCRFLLVFEDQVPHRRIAGRHMEKAAPPAWGWRPPRRLHGAAGDQPHHASLDALAAGLRARISDVRHLASLGGLGDQAIEEIIVPFPC